MALIELDLTTQPDLTLASPPPAYRYRLPGLILAVVLVIALGGAAAPGSTMWRYLGAVPPPGGAETQTRLVGDRIYTIAGSGGERVTTAFELGVSPPRARWTVRYPGRVIGPDDIGFGGVEARQSGDAVLLSDGPATTVVDADTGRSRFQSEVGITPLPGGHTGVVQNQVFREGTVYDQDSGDPGLLYFSSTGQPHVEPPVRTEIRGLDLTTGDTRWTIGLPGSINVLTVGSAVYVVASDRLERIDGDTGRVQRGILLPRLGTKRPIGGALVSGKIVVYYGVDGAPAEDVVYAPDTLSRLWEYPEPQVLLDPPSCGAVLCSGPRSALDVLDPATGRVGWRAPATVDLDVLGGYVIEMVTGEGTPIRLVDPATGATRVDLAGWDAEISGGVGAPLVLRKSLAGGRSAFGVVLDDRVQILGASNGPVSECGSNHAYVMCRGNDGLEIWSYRS